MCTAVQEFICQLGCENVKDTPFQWQPLTDAIFHIDKNKKWGFERRILLTVSVIAICSILYVGGVKI